MEFACHVLALQDKDIDLKNKIIHIRKTLTRSANNQIIMGNKTKTFSGVRDVPIQEIIFNEVKEQVDISKNHFNGQLFTSKNGRYADPKCVNKILKRIMVNTCITLSQKCHNKKICDTFCDR